MQVEWARTGLAALALVWVVFAWHLHDGLDRHERLRVEALITQYCASTEDAVGEKLRPTSDRERQECEILLRQRGLGGHGVAVSGSVDVSGDVEVKDWN